jgi:Zn-dependent peptidase ImmA (M78 family)
LSSEFSTSEDVILRRLLILGLTSREFYEYKHKEYIQRWHDFKEKRRAEAREGKGYSPPYYRLKLRANGKLYTKQVLSAYYDKQITLLDVSDFLGVKIRHIKDIEGEAFTSSIGA